MKKYEYKKIHSADLMVNRSIVIEKLNELGEQGWEMVGITNWVGKPAFIYFKREKVELCKHDKAITGWTNGKVETARRCLDCGMSLPEVIVKKNKKSKLKEVKGKFKIGETAIIKSNATLDFQPAGRRHEYHHGQKVRLQDVWIAYRVGSMWFREDELKKVNTKND